jgi:hypothetical protein
MGIAYNTSIVRDGLFLHLDAANPKSYSGSGTVWNDLSGNGNHGTLINGVGYDSADNGSMVFDGVDDQINLADVSSIKPVQEITIIQQFYFNLTGGNRQATLMVGRDLTSGYILWEQNGIFTVRLSGNSVSNFPISSNNWYNIIVTYKSGSGGSVFLNGKLKNDIGDQGDISYPEMYGTGPSIGSHGGIYESNVKISMCQVYNRALTEFEIKQNFNAIKGRYGI